MRGATVGTPGRKVEGQNNICEQTFAGPAPISQPDPMRTWPIAIKMMERQTVPSRFGRYRRLVALRITTGN